MAALYTAAGLHDGAFRWTRRAPNAGGADIWRCHMRCPGVGAVNTVSTAVHRWDGNYQRPTFAPSIRVLMGTKDGEEVLFHGYVIDGRIGTVSELAALKEAASPEAVAFFEASD